MVFFKIKKIIIFGDEVGKAHVDQFYSCLCLVIAVIVALTFVVRWLVYSCLQFKLTFSWQLLVFSVMYTNNIGWYISCSKIKQHQLKLQKIVDLMKNCFAVCSLSVRKGLGLKSHLSHVISPSLAPVYMPGFSLPWCTFVAVSTYTMSSHFHFPWWHGLKAIKIPFERYYMS